MPERINSKRRVMKGQMLFEFIIAAILFFAVVLYTINYLSSVVLVYSDSFYSVFLHTQAIQASEMLVKGQGLWYAGSPDVLGLSSNDPGWPVLSSVKIQNLETYCADPDNYNTLLTNLGLTQSQIRIIITEGENSWVCEPSTEMIGTGTVAHVKRYALSETQTPILVDVWVW